MPWLQLVGEYLCNFLDPSGGFLVVNNVLCKFLCNNMYNDESYFTSFIFGNISHAIFHEIIHSHVHIFSFKLPTAEKCKCSVRY